LSSSKRTFDGLTEEIPPRPLDALTVRLDQSQQFAPGPAVKAVIVGHPNFRAKPELRFSVPCPDVNAKYGSGQPAKALRWCAPSRGQDPQAEIVGDDDLVESRAIDAPTSTSLPTRARSCGASTSSLA